MSSISGHSGSSVSVGIPVWNGEKYLSEALSSVQNQEFDDLEIILSDNGSTDATPEICRTAAAADPRIRYLRSERNHGGTWNYNRLLHSARGQYFMWVAADDIILPSFVGRCLEVFESIPLETVLVCPRGRFIDSEGRVYEDRDDFNLNVAGAVPHDRVAALLRAQASHLMYGLIRRTALLKTRGLRPMVGDDMVLLLELACLGKIQLLQEQLLLQRRHQKQFSAQGQNEVKWHAPTARVSLAFPQTRLNAALALAALRAPLPAAERVRCVQAVVRHWILPRWRGVGTDVKSALGL